ncbi:MAG: diacylglycerol kinase family protein, partial [Flavobacteriales bacterium]
MISDLLNTWFVIINPASGNGFVKVKKNKILTSLDKLKSPFQVKFTEYKSHEEVLVKEAIAFGYRNFISVGGDGTLHHLVNGVMKFGSEFLSEIKVAALPVGTGNDWVKQYDIPKNIEKAIEVINKGKTVSQDIGKITSNKKEFYFNNLAGLGFDGFVVNTLPRFKKFGNLSYFLSAIVGLFKFKSPELTIQLEDKEIKTKAFLLAIGICKFCGGGMRLTNTPNPTDGLLDVTIINDLSRFSFLLNIMKMYNGKIANHKKVEVFK